MKYLKSLLVISSFFIFFSCSNTEDNAVKGDEFNYFVEQFADLKIIRYKIPGFEKLTVDQKKLAYFLTKAGLCGRDIIWDQNYKHNLRIRRALEGIVRNYKGDKESDMYNSFMVYVKRIWFSNGIHHHYSSSKIMPEFSKEYFVELLSNSGTELEEDLIDFIFDEERDAKKVNLDPEKGLVKASAVNFYEEGITEAEVDAYYQSIKDRSHSWLLT